MRRAISTESWPSRAIAKYPSLVLIARSAPLPACTGAAYDPCTDNAQCMSNDCRVFMGDGIQVCSQTCDAQNPCPAFNGVAVQCNGMGRCNPRGENMCQR
jgi:hypothetical protein